MSRVSQEHWLSCGADGRLVGGRQSAVGIRSRDYQIFWDGFTKLWGSADARASRARGAPL